MLRWAELVFRPSGSARERRQGSEEVKSREGVAAGGATKTKIFFLLFKKVIFPMRNVGQVAQLVEQLTLNQLVKGSSPFLPTDVYYNNRV